MDDPLARLVLVVQEFIGGGRPLGDTLNEIAALGTTTLGSDMAGLTLTDGDHRARTVAYTDRIVPEIDEAQYAAGSGPCIDAARDGAVRCLSGIERDPPWPEYRRAAARHGIQSTLSVPLIVGASSIGALNFYDARPAYFDDARSRSGQVFAGQSAIVAAYYGKADMADQMAQAMATRAAIEQAKGIIMATVGCAPDRAFEILREQSQTQNVKLRDIAVELVERQARKPA